ncbi:MAG TPA: hypothetical protein PLR88_00485 [Bacteroidales bacterium]|nr:hypothetical protein [Bacteroidales bacterium]HPT20392.1 hypothetical protein [Bacteroidales bacterium]
MKKGKISNQIIYQNRNIKCFSRRNFISSCSACAVCMAITPGSFANTLCSSDGKRKKLKIRILYSLSGPVHTLPRAWPNIGFDFTPAMEQINTTLVKNFPEFEFFPELAAGPEDAEKIAARGTTDSIDGYIVYQMELWNKVVQTIATTGKPVLYADFKYGGSGGFLRYISAFIRDNTPNVGFISSSKTEDLLAAVSCFKIISNGGTAADFAAATRVARIKGTKPKSNYMLRENKIQSLSADECIGRLKNSKILAVRDQKSETAEPIMNIPLEYIPFSEINDAWSKADKDEAAAIAERWSKAALDIVNVSQDTILSSAAMYIGMKSVMKKHEANAITINCLGGFTGGYINAYPCLGFQEFFNEGLVGACECDVQSTATMLAFSTMTNGRPGFISDPVIDTSKRQIIYAHCVAPIKVFGPEGEANPFRIMTHSEDRKGASIQSILPLNYLTTTIEIRKAEKEILFHQAVAVENDADDRACRTKLCAEPVGDIETLFTLWDKWNWHRVTFYGDLKEQVLSLADAIGWKAIEQA